jgi:hypothetical protein
MKDKIIIIGESSVGIYAHVRSLIDEQKFEVLSFEQAKEKGYTLSSRPAIDYPAPIAIDVPMHFPPPINRAQRRKQARKY